MNSLEFAIEMELDGVRYYTEQAERNLGNKLNAIFLMLARDEEEHARVIRKFIDGFDFKLTNNHTLREAKSIFSGEPDFTMDTKEQPDELDVYMAALDKEEKSIELYTELLESAEEERERELFEFLIEQEKEHHSIIDSILTLVNRPNDWVEDAEFGLREDY